MKIPLTPTLILFAVIAMGCSNTGDVSGRVTLDGKPVVCGTVMMAGSPKGVPIYGVIRNDGSYSIKEVPAGNVYVAVNSPRRIDGRTMQTVEGWFPIPAKYNDFLSSGLKFTVEKGENTFDIELAGTATLAGTGTRP